MARKFSLEALLNLGDGLSGPLGSMQKKMLGFSQKMKGSFGGAARSVLAIDKGINKVIKSAAVMATGAAVAAAALIQTTANAGDRFAKTSRMIGMTAEELQALTYAADIQGVSNETLTNSLQKMNRNIGDLRAGTGTLATYLGKTDRALMNQLRGVKNNEEAFALLIGKLHDIPDEFGKAAFAQAAFGRSGMDMLKLAEAGKDGIRALTDEARRYGLITNEAAVISEAYNDELTRLKAMLLGFKNRLASAVLPKLAELVTAFRKMIEGAGGGEKIIEKLRRRIEKLDVQKIVAGAKRFWEWIQRVGRVVGRFIKIVGPLIPWILGFAAAIKILALGIKAWILVQMILNSALFANPIGLIILAIIALTVYIGIAIKYWDKFGAAMLFVLGPLGQLINFIIELRRNWEAVTAAFEHGGILAGLKTIGLVLVKSLIRPIEQFLQLLAKIPGVNKLLGGAIAKLGEVQANLQTEVDVYKNPQTQTAESRSYKESVNRNEVFVRPDRGTAVSRKPGGPPERALLYGAQ